MMRTFLRASLLAAAVLVAHAAPAAAADYETWLSSANAMRWQSDAAWKVNLGAGFATVPKFDYSSDNELVFLPMVDIEWRNFVFASTQRGVGVKLVNNGRSEGGVRLTYDFGRDPTDDDLLAGTNKVDATQQVGAYWMTYVGPWRWSADFKYATSSYESFLVTLGLAQIGRAHV